MSPGITPSSHKSWTSRRVTSYPTVCTYTSRGSGSPLHREVAVKYSHSHRPICQCGDRRFSMSAALTSGFVSAQRMKIYADGCGVGSLGGGCSSHLDRKS